MSKRTTKTPETKTELTREQMIAEYRKLGADMKALRASHILDIENLIKQYKADKAAIVKQRYELLLKIRAPKDGEAVPEVEEAEVA